MPTAACSKVARNRSSLSLSLSLGPFVPDVAPHDAQVARGFAPLRPQGDGDPFGAGRSAVFPVPGPLATPPTRLGQLLEFLGKFVVAVVSGDHLFYRTTQRLVGRPAEHPLCALVPGRKHEPRVRGQDGVVDVLQQACVVAAQLLGPPLPGHVAHEEHTSDHTSFLVENRPGTAADREAPTLGEGINVLLVSNLLARQDGAYQRPPFGFEGSSIGERDAEIQKIFDLSEVGGHGSAQVPLYHPPGTIVDEQEFPGRGLGDESGDGHPTESLLDAYPLDLLRIEQPGPLPDRRVGREELSLGTTRHAPMRGHRRLLGARANAQGRSQDAAPLRPLVWIIAHCPGEAKGTDVAGVRSEFSPHENDTYCSL